MRRARFLFKRTAAGFTFRSSFNLVLLRKCCARITTTRTALNHEILHLIVFVRLAKRGDAEVIIYHLSMQNVAPLIGLVRIREENSIHFKFKSYFPTWPRKCVEINFKQTNFLSEQKQPLAHVQILTLYSYFKFSVANILQYIHIFYVFTLL